MVNLQFEDKFNATQKSSSIVVNQTYSYINNTGFYALANPTYFQYYYRFVRRVAWWYDRYVPDFHNAEQGYFSTGIGHAIVDGIANQIVGRKLLFQNVHKELDRSMVNDTLKRVDKWADDVNFTSKARTLTKYAGALGTSLLKTNVASDGELWVEPLRFDDFFFKCDFRGELQDVVCLIKSYTDTIPRSVEWADSFGENGKQCLFGKYYLVEHRYYKMVEEVVDGQTVKHNVPYVKYQVHTYKGNIINQQSWSMANQEQVRFDSLPRGVRKAIVKDYGAVFIDKEIRLPFVDLGCDIYRYNDADGSLSQQPFGQSILTDIISDLMNYELAFAYAVRDMYMGKGIVFMAKELQTAISGTSAYTGIDDTLYQLVQSWNESGKLPIESVQFNIRVEEWKKKRDAIIEEIAFKLSISPSSLASFLGGSVQRDVTAKEVSTEQQATDSYIDIQRSSLSRCLNKCLKRVSNYYGWEDEVNVRYSQSGVQNIDAIVDRVIKLKQAGLIEPYEALRQIMFDADESQVEEAYEKLKKYNDEEYNKQQNSMFGSMDFGETKINEEEV